NTGSGKLARHFIAIIMPAAAPTHRHRTVLGKAFGEITGEAFELLAAIGEDGGAFAAGKAIHASARPADIVASLGVGIKKGTTRVGINQPMRIDVCERQ